mmetsp:Transcript_36596/g.46620  ORF Transcript_36596/g.46620 Transcript_36596/m.46620 type:complete len:116 (-) Transcript_36596:243-590(-)
MENIEEQENQLDHGNDTSDNEDNFLNEEPDPFYDEAMDEKDELWVNKNLRKEALSGKKQSSGTLLSCPACFTTLCMDCQQLKTVRKERFTILLLVKFARQLLVSWILKKFIIFSM